MTTSGFSLDDFLAAWDKGLSAITASPVTCAHCGQQARGFAMIEGSRVCHTDEADYPDCYRRITVHDEILGALRGMLIPPGGTAEAGHYPPEE